MSTEYHHSLRRIADVGGGLIPLATIVVVLWGVPWAKSHGLEPLGIVVALGLAFLSGLVIADRAAKLAGED